jgi:hypothetical protein
LGILISIILEAAKIAENNRTHPAAEMGLRGGTCFTFKKIVAVKGTGHMKRWMVQWEEKYPGEWKDEKYTWKPAINVGKEHRDRFDADYVPVEKGVRSNVCFNPHGLLFHPMTH